MGTGVIAAHFLPARTVGGERHGVAFAVAFGALATGARPAPGSQTPGTQPSPVALPGGDRSVAVWHRHVQSFFQRVLSLATILGSAHGLVGFSFTHRAGGRDPIGTAGLRPLWTPARNRGDAACHGGGADVPGGF